ncbi:MAG TPA: hypothetical protein VJJ83_05060, partial [Candidatus Babeliales bacterium]|nr:hypothetical protein [Candidatus Babeliales bacterium]
SWGIPFLNDQISHPLDSWGISFFNTLGPNALNATDQVCFDLKQARRLMQKYRLVPPQFKVTELNENSRELQRFVLGCQFLKYFNDGVVANTSTELREEQCKYLRSLVAPCSELFCDDRTYRAAAETMTCSLGGSDVMAPLVPGPGPQCATLDTLARVDQSYVNLRDGLRVLGVDFMNLPFTPNTFDHTAQVNFDLTTVQKTLADLGLVTPAAAAKLTANSDELQKFIFGCEFLRRNPRVMAQNDLILRDTVCQYVEKIAVGCARVYCNPAFIDAQRSITCHKRGIGQINPRGRPYPAYEQFGLAAQLFPETHIPMGGFVGNNV